MLATAPLRAALLSQKALVRILARFSANLAAPLGASLPIDIGEPFTVTDATGVLSQAGGVLVGSGTPAATSGLVYPTLQARERAMALAVKATWSVGNGGVRVGLNTAVALTSTTAAWHMPSTTTIRPWSGTGAEWWPETVTAGATIELLILPRREAAGYFYFWREGSSGPYTLGYVKSDGTPNFLVPNVVMTAATLQGWTLDDLRLVRLTNWPGESLAVTALIAPAAGSTASGVADGIVEWTFTASATVTQEIRFRWTDANNCWIARASQSGSTLKLFERNAGVEVERASSPRTWTNGTSYRVPIFLRGASIHAATGQVNAGAIAQSASYLTATFNQTATGLQTDAAVAPVSLYAWPRQYSFTPEQIAA